MESLNKLKLQVSDTVKDQHFKQITEKLNLCPEPKPTKLPVIVSLCMVAIIMLLMFNMPISNNSAESDAIQKIYVNDLELPSHSKWYPGVKEAKAPDFFILTKYVISHLKEIEDKDYYNQGRDFTFTTFTVKDKTRYELITFYDVFYNRTNDQFYSFEGDEKKLEQFKLALQDINNNENIGWRISIITIYFLLTSLIEKKYYPRNDEGHKYPQHSIPMQSAIRIVFIAFVVGSLLIYHTMHIGYLFLATTLLIAILILLETKFGDNAKWRKLFFFHNYWIVVLVYLIL